MNILMSCVPFDGGTSGISVYMRSVARALSAAGHRLTLIVEKDAQESFSDYDKIVLPGFCRKAVFSMLYHLFVLPFRIRWRDYDCCLLAAANRRVFCRFPIFTMAVVHDLSQYHVKAKYDAFRMFYIMRVLPHFVRRAQSVIAISSSTAEDLKQFWKIPEERISIVYNGLSLRPPKYAPATSWRERIGVNKPYILYISRLEHPGKNHVGHIEAYNRLPGELAEKYDLVLPGREWNGSDQIFAAVAQSPRRGSIHFTGFIDDDDMREAYTHAACYVFPSFFEGFGLSLIEAMHYGIPCACSETSSLGEIGKGAALLFNPDKPQEICDAISSILSSDETRRRLVTAGFKRAAEFTWEDAAAKMAAIAQRSLK